MKFIFFIALLVSTNLSIGQSQQGNRKYITWYLDSTEIEAGKCFFDTDIIETVQVTIDSASSTKKIYITSKKRKTYRFIPIIDAIKDSIQSLSSPNLFMVDNEFLKDDIRSYQIDSFYILKIEVTRAKQFASLNGQNSDLLIIRIKTRSPENLKEEEKLNFKGQKKE